MNVPLVATVLLVLCLCWRLLTENRVVQRCLSALGPVGALFQWYTVLFLGMGYLLARTFYDFVVFEYFKYNFLASPEPFVYDLPLQEQHDLLITPWLRIVSLLSPIAGVAAGCLVVLQVYRLVMSGIRHRRHEAGGATWDPSVEENIVYFVVAMPLVSIVMAMRAEIRCLAVMTGSCWLPYEGEKDAPYTWDELKTLELDTFDITLEVGNFFQFCTIFAFGRLVVACLRQAKPEYQWALKWAGLQGCYLYVIAGLARSLISLASVLMTEQAKTGPLAAASAALRTKVMTQLSPVFNVATLLCVYNMIVLGGMKEVVDKLGNANLKFQGVRALVLVSQIQQVVLNMVVVGSPFYQDVGKLPAPVAASVHWSHLSASRAKLLHSSLLCYECLAVVVFNYWAWGTDNRFRSRSATPAAARARELRAEEPGGPPLQQPLLAAGA